MPEQHYAFHFNLPEGCILFLSALISFFLVFAFGVYIGKEVQAYKTAQETRTVRFPIHTSADASRPPASPPSRPLVEKHLSKPEPQPHRLSSLSISAPPLSPATREKSRTVPQPVVSAGAAKPEIQKEIQKKQGTGSGSWSIQVHVTKKRHTAQDIAAELRRQGHAATVNTITRHGEVWYRIRVGTFTQKEAQLLASRFRREGKFTQAFLVSD